MNARHLVAVLALSLFFGLTPARADTPQVYDLAGGPGNSRDLSLGSQMLEVYIDLGGDVSMGTPCADGNGDELCAVDLRLTLNGPGQIDAFTAPMTGPTIVSEPTAFPTSVLRLNLLQWSSPPSPAPQSLGFLTIDVFSNASESNRVKVVATGQAVGAAGTLVTIPSWQIAATPVPEPSALILLLSGVLGLAALHGLRTRSATVAARSGRQSPR
jgi:hypothetical protein